MQKVTRNILLNPGPATTSDTVKYAQVVPDICPREREFGDLMGYISTNLTRFVADPDEFTTVLFGSSGTGVVEAVISSVVPYSKPGEKKLLIVNNGAYGERMCQIARTYDIPFVEFKASLFEPIDTHSLEEAIKNEQAVSHLAVVQNETTSGLLNDIQFLGTLCKKYHIDMIVDAMSSYAAIPIDMKMMNISFLMSSSNKNIQAMAGVSFAICRNKALLGLKDQKPRSFYFDLYDQYQYFMKNHQMRFTPPVQTLYALKQAIDELKLETVVKRYERYSKSWKTLIEGLEKIGLKHLVDEKHHSKIITTVIEPQNAKYSFTEMHDFLIEKGFTIYPGKVSGANTFRIANIGAIDEDDIRRFLNELKLYMDKIGGAS